MLCEICFCPGVVIKMPDFKFMSRTEKLVVKLKWALLLGWKHGVIWMELSPQVVHKNSCIIGNCSFMVVFAGVCCFRSISILIVHVTPLLLCFSYAEDVKGMLYVLTCVVEPGPSSLGSMLMPAQETEWAELIRTGQMTPFGTKIPQKPERKARQLRLNEASDFEKYLADQAKLSYERKKLSRHKGAKKKAQAKNVQCVAPAAATKEKSGKALSKTDKRLKKHLRELQKHALQIHSKARIPKEKKYLEAKKLRQEDDSEESEYVPDEELFDPEAAEEEEEQASSLAENDSDYELKSLSRKRKHLVKKGFKEAESDADFVPSSGEEEPTPGKHKVRRWRDDGDVDYYKQRLRLVLDIFISNANKLVC